MIAEEFSPILHTFLTSLVVISKSLNHLRRPLLGRLSNPMKTVATHAARGSFFYE